MSTTITTNADPAATATNPTNNNNTWMERMRLALCSTNNGGRYEPVMRRSLQTCLLYEAKRVVDANYQDLRPFQRKLAFYDVLHALVDSICFLPLPQMRAELLWRTATSKVPLDADVAWKRAKLIEKEMARLAQEVKPLVVAGRSHAESVTMLVQQLFNKTNIDGSIRPLPMNWEHAHNHVITAFRIYYRGFEIDTSMPPPILPREVAIPTERPMKSLPHQQQQLQQQLQPNYYNRAPLKRDAHNPYYGSFPPAPSPAIKRETQITAAAAGEDSDDPHMDVGAILLGTTTADPMEERRRTMAEVREHLELLKEFEGSISQEDLAQRKRDLFLAMPPAPPAAAALKKPKLNE